MIYRVSLLAILLASSLAQVGQAQHTTITSSQTARLKSAALVVEPNKAADLTVKLAETDSIIWRIDPSPAWRASNLTEGRLVFTGVPGTTYTVTAITLRVVTTEGKNKVVTDEAETTVTFAGIPPPGPGPVPPFPPNPNSDLATRLQQAYTADPGPTKAADLANLRFAMQQAATTAMNTAITTKSALVRQVNTDTKARVGQGKLIALGSVIGQYMDAAMGTVDAPLTQAIRQQHADAYNAVANALSQVR